MMSADQVEEIIRGLRLLTCDHERRWRVVERMLGYGFGAIGMVLFLLKQWGKL